MSRLPLPRSWWRITHLDKIRTKQACITARVVINPVQSDLRHKVDLWPYHTDACRTVYPSAINGTDRSAMLPRSSTAATYVWPVWGGFTGQQDIA